MSDNKTQLTNMAESNQNKIFHPSVAVDPLKGDEGKSDQKIKE